MSIIAALSASQNQTKEDFHKNKTSTMKIGKKKKSAKMVVYLASSSSRLWSDQCAYCIKNKTETHWILH